MTRQPEKYYKKLTDLTIQELCCYGLKLGLERSSVGYVKSDVIKRIVAKEPDFLDFPSKKFYFENVQKEEGGRNRNMLNYVANPQDKAVYAAKQQNPHQKIDVAQIKAELETEVEKTEHESLDLDNFIMKNDVMIDKSVIGDSNELNEEPTNQSNQLAELLAKMTTSTRPSNTGYVNNIGYRQKLKYEPSHGIEAFIRSVETYCQANDITGNEKQIAIAKSALNSSDDGLLLQDSLLPAEENDWELFKQKLLSILGNPPDYYRDFYRSFRRGSQKVGIAMSRLTQAYKRGFLNPGAQLTESDQAHIMHQFINSLDNPLRGLLKAEEKKLKFSTIAERAGELERCFGSNFAPDSAATLMFPEARVSVVKSQNALEAGNTIQLKMIELMNAMMTENKKQHHEMMNQFKKGQSNNGQSNFGRHQTRQPSGRSHFLKDIAPKLKGFCYFYVKNNSCNRSDCTYKHDRDVPKDVKDACK